MSEQKQSGKWHVCAACAAMERLYREADASGTATLAAIVHEGDTRLMQRITTHSIELREPMMALRKMAQDEIIRRTLDSIRP